MIPKGQRNSVLIIKFHSTDGCFSRGATESSVHACSRSSSPVVPNSCDAITHSRHGCLSKSAYCSSSSSHAHAICTVSSHAHAICTASSHAHAICTASSHAHAICTASSHAHVTCTGTYQMYCHSSAASAWFQSPDGLPDCDRDRD